MQIINTLIQMFMGAVSGYYTNKLAISHLFTDIPLPGGFSWKAVIKKGGNKERLAKDLSEIAEDKILGKQLGNAEIKDSYLQQELSKKEVLTALDQCIEDIFQELEHSSMGQKKLLELMENFLKQEMPYELQKLLLTAAADWKIGDFIKEETFLSFCEEFWQMELYPKLQGEYGLDSLIENFCRELSANKDSVTFEMILGQELCKELEEVFIEKIIEIFHAMEKDNNSVKMEGYLHSICRQLGIETMLRRLLISLREKELGDLLSLQDKQWFCEKLNVILEQPKIKENLQRLFLIIVKNFQEADLSLSDLLPEHCLEDHMAEILAGQIKDLQGFINDLYNENLEFISARLMQEMNTAIEEGTGNFLQNMVLLTAKDMIFEKMQEFLKEKMPEKIQDFLNNPSESVCLELCHAIGRVKVSKLIDKISFDNIYISFKEALSPEYLGGTFLEKINHISLSLILSDDIINYLSKRADKLLLNTVSKWLKEEKKEKQIRNIVSFLFQKLVKKPFGKQEAESLLKEVKKHSLPEKLLKYVTKKEMSVFQWIYKRVSKIYIKDLLAGPEKKAEILSQKMVENIVETYKDKLTIGSIILAVPKEPIKQKAEELFTKKAGSYLSIKPIVERKVLALDEDSLCTMMQKFMGTQLRPLNQIGGALGAMVGLLIGLLNPSMEMTLPMIVVTMLCYALIGIGTNILALHGLFRPYHIKERKWLGRFAGQKGVIARSIMSCYDFLSKIPGVRNVVCLGYIPEKKDMIAEQLASFVANNFLKPKDLLPEIQWEPEAVQKFLKDHSSIIAEQAAEKLQKSDWEHIIKTWIAEESGKKREIWPILKSVDFSFLAKMISPVLEKIQKQPIGNYINAGQAAEGLTGFLQMQIGNTKEKQTEIIKYLQKWYEKILQKRAVKEFLSERQDMIAGQAAEKFCQFFYGEEFSKQAGNFILKELLTDKCITFLLNGNMGDIKMFVFHILKKECCQYLLNHEEDLVDKVDLEIQNMINTMADVQLGAMASTMLGTKQLIGKVFHRTFIEPQFQEILSQEETMETEQEDKKELLMQERLSDELFDKNEKQIVEKIEEILKTKVFTLTGKDLEELLFVSKDLDITIEKEQWIYNLLNTGTSILHKDKKELLESIQDLGENILLIAQEYTIESYVNLLRNDFLQLVWDEIWTDVLEAIQKPAMKQDLTAFFEYTITSYLLKDNCNRYLSTITEDSLTVLLQKNQELWKHSSSIELFLSNMLDFHGSNIIEYGSSSALIKEFADLWKEKDSIQQGFREFFNESINLLLKESNQDLKDIFLEILDSVNEEYNKTSLVAVAEKIDFANIIYLAVMDMTDEQIEELFKGFAGSYFLSLKLSGILGFVFGVPIVKWAALIAAFGSEFVGKDRR